MKHKPACSAMRPNTAPASPAEAVIICFDKGSSSVLVRKSQEYVTDEESEAT